MIRFTTADLCDDNANKKQFHLVLNMFFEHLDIAKWADIILISGLRR